MSSDAFNRLDAVVKQILDERGDYRTLTEWENIKVAYNKLPEHQEELRLLQEKVQKLAEPPLKYAVYIGPCPQDERYLVVGSGGTRIEVQRPDESMLSVADLVPGQLLALNKEDNIVAARDEYVCGEIAEVINLLRGDEEAEVLSVSEGPPLQLLVRWREKQEINVTCSEDLAREGVLRGESVRIDPDQKMAVAKARPRLHVKIGGSEGTVVETSIRLARQGVQIGDIVRIEPGLKLAMEKLPAYETGKLTLEEVPDVTYDDIGGLDEQIGQIYDAIEMPYLFREQFERYQLVRPRGILLYGPPGCGKTMVAKAVANSLTTNIRNHLSELENYIVLYKDLQERPGDAELETRSLALRTRQEQESTNVSDDAAGALAYLEQKLRQYDIDINALDEKLQEIRAVLARKDGVRSFFLNVKGPELLDKYVGETEHRIRKIFEEARLHSSYYTPVVIFFDEMEAMFRTRGSGHSSDIETTIVPQFLTELDGVESIENLVIIGASNRQDMIDPAILRPGRLDVKIKVDRPSRASALDIFAMYLLPTLPLGSEGVSITGVDGELGEVVFRTAYRPVDAKKHAQGNVALLQEIHELLPPGCDLRLVRSISGVDLEALANLHPSLKVREVLRLYQEDMPLWKCLRRFKTELEIGEVVMSIRRFQQRCEQDARFGADIEYFTQQEWIAEAILLQTVDLLYSPGCAIGALTTGGNRYTFQLKDFVTGAIIGNIVTRAKREALKRLLFEKDLQRNGIILEDMREAIKNEFNENKDQLAQYKLQDIVQGKEDIQPPVELSMEAQESDPWSEKKIQFLRGSIAIIA